MCYNVFVLADKVGHAFLSGPNGDSQTAYPCASSAHGVLTDLSAKAVGPHAVSIRRLTG